MRTLNSMFDGLLKQAEKLMENQQFISKLLDQAFEKMGKVSEKLYDIQDQLFAMIRMLTAWVKREYTEVSPKAIIAVIAALMYFVNPLDLISDVIPFIGFLDDITILTYVVSVFNKEIERFMDWETAKAGI